MLLLVYALALLALPVGWHYSSLHLPLILGGLLAAVATVVYALGRGRALGRYALPLLMCSGTALLVQVSLGTLEFHFGVFVSLALVMVYREWRVLLACAAFFALHHFSFDRLQAWGYGFYCTPEADFQKIVLHALFVVCQTAVEIWIVCNMSKSVRQGLELEALVNTVAAGEKINLNMASLCVSTPLAQRLQQLFHDMYSVVHTVARSSAQVQTASQEIEWGSQDLSNRTELACSALEETANAAARVVSTLEQAHQLTTQATQMSRAASDTAQQGQRVVDALADSMQDIRQQSAQIADIVSVVDGLAFQTNLLALNAAVEAARAGEQGRGFGVVAEEVRRLALRSAECAKQIRQLVEASTHTVGMGATQSQAARAAMQQLLQACTSTTQHMQEIQQASQAQNQSMGEITQAIEQLESAMSQNSALAEESNAAAASLQDQTVAMLHSVQVFQLRDAATGADLRLRH